MASSLITIACVLAPIFDVGYSRRTSTPIPTHGSSHPLSTESQSRISAGHGETRQHLASLLLASNPALSVRPPRIGQEHIVTAARASPKFDLLHSSDSHAHLPRVMNATQASAHQRSSSHRARSTVHMNASQAEADVGSSPPSRTQLQIALDLIKVLILGGACLLLGFYALFFVTNFFESMMHSTAGLLGTGGGPLFVGGTGFAAGILHTLAGPDHFVGVMPMVVGQPISTARAVFLGALWGSGHAVGQLFLGMVFLALQLGLLRFIEASFLAEQLARASGFLVGFSLISIGVLGVMEAKEFDEAQASSTETERFGRRSFFTGVFHGLSPDSMIFLAPALALPRLAAILHVSGVFLGTLAAMAMAAAALKILCRKSPRLKYISGGASLAAILLGSCLFLAALGVSVKLPFMQA